MGADVTGEGGYAGGAMRSAERDEIGAAYEGGFGSAVWTKCVRYEEILFVIWFSRERWRTQA